MVPVTASGAGGTGAYRYFSAIARISFHLEALGRACLRASLDDFHPPGYQHWEKSADIAPAQYLREGYDYAKIRELLLDPFGPQGNRRCRLDYWNFHDDEPFAEDWQDVAKDAILLVDGVFLHTPELREQWDFTIWLDVDWQSMLRRAARRDGTPGGSAELAREAYKTGWIPRHLWYEQSVHPRERVDVVIDNSDVEHPYIVRAPSPTRRVP